MKDVSFSFNRVFVWLLVSGVFLPVVHAKEKSASVKQESQHNILFVGDSHSVGIFGHALTTLLKENTASGTRITTVASCGSSPSWWLEGKDTRCGFWRRDFDGSEQSNLKAATPSLYGLLNSVKPKTVIVALGSNLVPLSKIARHDHTDAMMRHVAKTAEQCIWIGPPDSRKFSASEINDVYVLLQQLTNKHGCKLVDSRKYTHYPKSGGDGLHYGGKQGAVIAKNWADNVFWNDIVQDI
jgi:hypothetical protein